jgi:hypothetical protein
METADRPARGRPRGHSGSAEREAQVLALLEQHPEGLRRNDIVALMDPQGREDARFPGRVWWSLKRLRDEGRIKPCTPKAGQGRQWLWTTGGCDR